MAETGAQRGNSERERAATWGHREGHRGEHRKGARRGARRGSSERGAQRGQAQRGVLQRGFKKDRKNSQFCRRKRLKSNDFGGSNPVFGSSPFLCWSLGFLLSVSVLLFFSAQGGREHLFSMCFVDGSDRHPRKIHYDSQVYFVLSLCFVDHCSVVPTHTNTKYLLVPTFILCSRFPSLIIGHCVRYTPTQNT